MEEATRLSEDKTLESSEARDDIALKIAAGEEEVCVGGGVDVDGVGMSSDRTKLGTGEGRVVGADVGMSDGCGGTMPGVIDGITPGV